jgi:hypothetical protein
MMFGAKINGQFYGWTPYPNCTMGVDNLRVTWEACPTDCTPLGIRDLNIRFENPANDKADAIIELLEEININNLPSKYTPQRCSQQWKRHAGPSACRGEERGATCSQTIYWLMSALQRGFGRWHFSCRGTMIWITAWLLPPSGGGVHVISSHTNANNSASSLHLPKGRRLNSRVFLVVLLQSVSNPSCASGKGMIGSLTRRGPWSDSEWPCGGLESYCMQRGGGENISSGLLFATAGQLAKKGIGNAIEAELAKGDVREAFRLLKGWYQVASDTCPKPFTGVEEYCLGEVYKGRSRL